VQKLSKFQVKMTRNNNIRGVFRQTGPLKKYAFNGLKKLWYAGVAVFVRELASGTVIDSGMSTAYLRPLGWEVGIKNVMELAMRSESKHKGRNSKYTAYGKFSSGSGAFKSAPLGASLGKSAYKVSAGSPQRFALIFEFDITVLQFHLQDKGLAKNQSSQWVQGSLDRAGEAMIEFVDNNLEKYVPKGPIYEYLITGKSPFNRTVDFFDV